MYRYFFLSLGCLFFLAAGVLPTAAQTVNLRERGWSKEQVQAWLEAEGAKPVSERAYNMGADPECPDYTRRRDVILNGNRITTQITNFGSISSPGNSLTDIVWNGLGYGYEFGPFVAVKVPVEDPETGQTREQVIVSDGLVSFGEISPDGSEYWGWQPIPCAQPVGSFEGLRVVNPNSNRIPTNNAPDRDGDGKPDSWPESFYNENLGRYVWPGALQQGASNAEQEALYFMNDYSNREFNYYPFPSDSTKRGLGLEVEARLYQWSNPLAEDMIFLIYKITNKSEKDLEDVIFGMWGDPHVGGTSDYSDDLASFDRDINMVYTWDDDGISDIAGIEPGYFGYKFLESPGVGRGCIGGHASTPEACEAQGGRFFAGNRVDDDNDGYVDESWTDGIDNNGNWDPTRHDVGIDGIPETGDLGEGDGKPTPGSQFDITKPGEPNFEFTDIEESDMIGLTSFASPPWISAQVRNDDYVWSLVQPGSFEDVPNSPGDYVFVYGSGPFDLLAGQTKRYSIALLLGANREDLTLNATIAQDIYDSGYLFAKPPDLPTVRAVAGDEQVTLYWDDRAESSIDPLSLEKDFEGYVIYRSTDHTFEDQQVITDVNGADFLFKPLEKADGTDAKWDLINGITGPAPIPYRGFGISYDLGDDTGLVHSFVDSNNVINGQRYFYAVVAYDRGTQNPAADAAEGISPTETTKSITYNPTTGEYFFDKNTVAVIPSPRVAGYVPPAVVEQEVEHVAGEGTGAVQVSIVDELAVRPDNAYRIVFGRAEENLTYSVINERGVNVTFAASPGRFTSLGYTHIIPSTFELALSSGDALLVLDSTDYELNEALGSVQPLADGRVEEGDSLVAYFKYYPVYRITNLSFESSLANNLVFDGLQLAVNDEMLGVDEEATGWIQGKDIGYELILEATTGNGRMAQPYDYEIRFFDSPVETGLANDLPLPFRVINLTLANQQAEVYSPDINDNGQWDVNEPIVFIEQIDGEEISTWEIRLAPDADSVSAPGGGDIFYFQTTKPFTSDDTFLFQTQAAHVSAEKAGEELDEIYVVPNPYVAFNALESPNPTDRAARGERRLYFANVPKQCTIRIYTLAGELVDVIHHDGQLHDGKAYWNLRTLDNMNVSYGLYFYHVESPHGVQTGKFAIIK